MVMMVVQELERVEIQLEQSEQSVVGGSLPLVEVEEGTAAAASASIQTSATIASSSVMPLSRDEHMRLRLVALISSLQFAARYGVYLLCCVQSAASSSSSMPHASQTGRRAAAGGGRRCCL
jgi:hypothetical protein